MCEPGDDAGRFVVEMPVFFAHERRTMLGPVNQISRCGNSDISVLAVPLRVGKNISPVLALNQASVVKANCSPTFSCMPAGVTAGSSGKTDSVVSTTGFIAGGVLAAAGVYLLVTTWGKAPATPAPGPAPAIDALVLIPTFDRSGGGLSAAWTF